jgi:tetratricopeptide (TPR) repeat protein
VARALDAALRAGGTLISLLAEPTDKPGASHPPEAVTAGGRRDRLTHATERRRPDLAVVSSLAETQAALRRAEDEVGAGPVLALTLAQARLVDALTCDASGATLRALVREAAQWSQFTAWLHADLGDADVAERWYLRAAEQAREAEDLDMVATVLSMRSQRAWGIGNAPLAVGLAEGALAIPGVHPAVRSQAAQQLARGLAMLGDHARVDRLLDEAEELAHDAVARSDDVPPWLYFHDPARTRVQRAIAYTEAGRGRDAATILTDAIGRTRQEEVRDRGWNLGRLALAHAMDGEADAAVDAARRAVAIAARSPHTASDLRSAARLLRARGARRQADELDGLAG